MRHKRKRGLPVRLTSWRSPANAASQNISDREALWRGRVPHQNVRPLRNGRLGKARAAFGGCNDKLCNGGHRGDSWDSGLVRSEPDAADSELGLAVGIFGAVKSSGRLGPRLQRVSVAIASSAITLGARRDVWERVGDFQLQQPSWRLGLGSAAPRRRCDDWITRHTFTRERRASSRQSARRRRRGRVPHQSGRPRTRNGR